MSEAESPKVSGKSYSLIDLRDVLGIGKSTDRLISMLEKGVGALWRPRQIRREGAAQRAETEEWLELAKRHGLASSTLEASVAERGFARLIAETATRQGNRESIAELALEEHKHLPNPEDANSEPSLSDDWLDQFWRVAENYSDKDMQGLFARILANAAVRNRAYSPRLLSTLQILDRTEIEAIATVAPFLGSYLGPSGEKEYFVSISWGHPVSEIAKKLASMPKDTKAEVLGPMGAFVESGVLYQIKTKRDRKDVDFTFFGCRMHTAVQKEVMGEHHGPDYNYFGRGFRVTSLGAELFGLCAASALTVEYTTLLVELFREMTLIVTAKHSEEITP